MDTIEDSRKRLIVFFQGDLDLVNRYVERFGTQLSMQHINQIRNEAKDAIAREAAKGEDPTFLIEVDCPVCSKANIPFRELRAKSLTIYTDPFGAPMYAPSNGYRAINYNQYAVTVCPKCYFASPDRKDFRCYSPYSKQWTPSQLPPLVIRELLDTMGERLTLIEAEPEALAMFKMPRTLNAGILAYRLAIERAEIERRNGNAMSLFKMAFYWIKIALMERISNQDDTSSLIEARKHLEEAYRLSDFSSPVIEFQACYTLSALCLRLGDRKACRQYLGALDQIRNDFSQGKRNDNANIGPLNQWLEKGQQLWDRRDDEDIWDLPQAPKT
jgi:uncharacterized protein (DUF2225 family)